MSYWVLPESGIPVSATTVQRLTNDKHNTEAMKRRMDQYEEKLKRVVGAQSADLTNELQSVNLHQVIDPENEDPSFFEDFMRAIDDTAL
jgi:hypothetical protein